MVTKSTTAPVGASELERVDLGKNDPTTKKSGDPATGEEAVKVGAAQSVSSVAVEQGPTLDDCRGWASDGWGFVFGSIEEELPWLKYPDDVKARAVDKTAPVLFKYRDKLPDWFLRFREEIELGMFLGGMIFGGVKAYRDAKAAADLTKAKPAVTNVDQKEKPAQPAQPVADNVTRTA